MLWSPSYVCVMFIFHTCLNIGMNRRRSFLERVRNVRLLVNEKGELSLVEVIEFEGVSPNYARQIMKHVAEAHPDVFDLSHDWRLVIRRRVVPEASQEINRP